METSASAAIKRFGLTGMPVVQSKSPALFHAAYGGKYSYDLLAAATAAEAIALFHEKKLTGMNVTMPLKEVMVPFMDELDEGAGVLNAVNSVVLTAGKLKGYNTDVHGVTGALLEAGVVLQGTTCVVLGAGGAGRAAAYALVRAGAAVVLANRTVARAEAAAKWLHTGAAPLTEVFQNSSAYKVIINTLPDETGVAERLHLQSGQVLLDADYVHKPLQAACRQAGVLYIDGIRWLLHQAIPSYRLFTGEEPNAEAMGQVM